MLRTTTAIVLLVMSTMAVYADDAAPFVGEEFHMKGFACSNVLDTQKLGTLLIGEHMYLDEEIIKTIAVGKLACKFVNQSALYVGPISQSEFLVIGGEFIVDRYVPVDGVDDLYLWRTLRPILSTTVVGGA